MTVRAWIVVAAAVVVVVAGADAAAAQPRREQLARELASLMIDESVRRSVDQQVGRGVMQAVAGPLQERLNRRLLDVEWRLLSDIVGRFLDETLPPGRTEEIAAAIYARHFDESELGDLVSFQRSAVGRKAARLTGTIAAETLRAIESEVRRSPAMPQMLTDLQREFPVLGGSPQSP
jgi:hypothetical protein